MASDHCPACAFAVGTADRFCEACGQELSTDVLRTRWLTSTGTPITCQGCGSPALGTDGWCEGCGQRRPAAARRTELDLGVLATVTDLGHRHQRNEDAVGIGILPGALLAVVCDGVSSTDRADAASHAAVDAATAALLSALADGGDPERAIEAAVVQAQAAAAATAGPDPGDEPPSCTFVCATVTSKEVWVGWVGDSRAYWLPDLPDDTDQPVCLTIDDSLGAALTAAGVEESAVARNPQAGALMRWLGADATDTVPHLRTITPAGPGRVLVCSDGLFRYRPAATDLAAAVLAAGGEPAGPPLAAARGLVKLALDEGGHDNVTVALLPFPPPSEGLHP
jgi:serine/threonine protein phosphatase PrpC